MEVSTASTRKMHADNTGRRTPGTVQAIVQKKRRFLLSSLEDEQPVRSREKMTPKSQRQKRLLNYIGDVTVLEVHMNSAFWHGHVNVHALPKLTRSVDDREVTHHHAHARGTSALHTNHVEHISICRPRQLKRTIIAEPTWKQASERSRIQLLSA